MNDRARKQGSGEFAMHPLSDESVSDSGREKCEKCGETIVADYGHCTKAGGMHRPAAPSSELRERAREFPRDREFGYLWKPADVARFAAGVLREAEQKAATAIAQWDEWQEAAIEWQKKTQAAERERDEQKLLHETYKRQWEHRCEMLDKQVDMTTTAEKERDEARAELGKRGLCDRHRKLISSLLPADWCGACDSEEKMAQAKADERKRLLEIVTRDAEQDCCVNTLERALSAAALESTPDRSQPSAEGRE